MLHELINYIVSFAETLGYAGIFLMMVLESSFFPFPSEVAMIPAGVAISKGTMDFSFVLILGTLGALVGAIINYIIGYYLGGEKIKKFIRKFGKYFFIKEEHYDRSEKYFQKHGSITTFLARFITVIRQLISLPAGVFKMNFPKFLFFTGLGAGIWNLLLILIGYYFAENTEVMSEYKFEMLIGGILFIILVGGIYYFVNKNKKV